MANDPQLPNFKSVGKNHTRIATAHEELSREMLDLSNLPTVEGNRVLNALNVLTPEIATFRQSMEHQLAGINVRLDIKSKSAIFKATLILNHAAITIP